MVASLPPPFNLTLLHEKLDNDLKVLKDKQQATTLQETPSSEVYQIKEKFEPKDHYWIKKCPDRTIWQFVTKRVLFLPAVVDELVWRVETCLAEKGHQGLMIKGPHGIGKSHSIVNLVRQSLYHSNCKYFVTFIPDCAIWKDVTDLFKFICKPLDSNLGKLGINWTGMDMLNRKDLLDNFVEAIDAKLATQGRQWVFIFDQINKLFIRFPGITDISTLPFPFYYMYLITKRGWITTIILLQ